MASAAARCARPTSRSSSTWKRPSRRLLPKNVQTQMAAIDGLVADWSRIVTEEGQQLQTVGHHFSGSRPLNNEERSHIDRSGVCLSCHQEIPDQSLAVSLLHHIAEFTGQTPKTHDQHDRPGPQDPANRRLGAGARDRRRATGDCGRRRVVASEEATSLNDEMRRVSVPCFLASLLQKSLLKNRLQRMFHL